MSRQRQRGVAMVIVVAGLFAILAVVGLALDASHLIYNKARLQGIVDATALTAAKALDQTGSDTAATAAATAVFQTNLASSAEMQRILGVGAVPTITYSKLISPYISEVSGTVGLHYVRISVANLSISSGLLGLVGVRSLPVRASAIAGPSPAVGIACNIVPIALCTNGGSDFGYPATKIHALQTGAGTTPGYIRYLQFDDTGGASAVRQQLAGGFSSCVLNAGERIAIKTGVNSGPVQQGFNTRFNQYASNLSPTQYPPDPIQRTPSPALVIDNNGVITQGGTTVTQISQINYSYSVYAAALRNGPYDLTPVPVGQAVFKRRVVAAPMVDCASEVSKTVPVKGFRCLFLLQAADVSGTTLSMPVEIAPECEAGGRPGPVPPGTAGGVYVIELYRDPSSPDS